jgi:hypothetical protein
LRRIPALVLIVAALVAASLPARAQGPAEAPSEQPGPRATVPPCTAVPVETLDAVDSAHAKAGDFFRFQTLAPTTDGRQHVVIPAHTIGYGTVALAVQAGNQGRSGALLLQPLYLKMPDGSRLGVVMDYGATNLDKQGKSGELIPGYLGLLPVPGLGIAIGAVNYFRHGKDITIPRGTKFAIFPEDDPQSAFCQP